MGIFLPPPYKPTYTTVIKPVTDLIPGEYITLDGIHEEIEKLQYEGNNVRICFTIGWKITRKQNESIEIEIPNPPYYYTVNDVSDLTLAVYTDDTLPTTSETRTLIASFEYKELESNESKYTWHEALDKVNTLIDQLLSTGGNRLDNIWESKGIDVRIAFNKQ